MALLEDLFASADDKGRAFLAGLMAKMAASPADPDGAMAQADVPSGDLLAHVGGGLASKAVNTARSAITAPRDAYTGDLPIFDPATGHVSDEAMGRANEMAGIAMTGGLGGAMGEGVALGSGPIRAYHGSPHNFDKFDLSKIGTGEGAQAYGHGLYFAENEGVAKGYRDRLAAGDMTLDGKALSHGDATQQRMGQVLKARNNDVDAAIDLARRYEWPEVVSQLEANRAALKPPGHMYEVSVKTDPEHFLDWDKPLSQQSEYVQQALRKGPGEPSWAGEREFHDRFPSDLERFGDYRGSEAYARIAGDEAGQDMASGTLAKAGIPGIRFLDQGSRGAGEGSRNLVVFDDKTIEILRKYGLAGLAALGAGQGALGSMSGGLSPGPAEQ